MDDAVGDLAVVRWSRGLEGAIVVPSHQDCAIQGMPVVASFNTHPNTGQDYLQEPSETDKRSVRDDPDLKGADYLGEIVISEVIVYLIEPTGRVREVAAIAHLLA